MIAREKRPSDAGEVRCWQTEKAPALSPKIVSRGGSPPKAAALARAHLMASR